MKTAISLMLLISLSFVQGNRPPSRASPSPVSASSVTRPLPSPTPSPLPEVSTEDWEEPTEIVSPTKGEEPTENGFPTDGEEPTENITTLPPPPPPPQQCDDIKDEATCIATRPCPNTEDGLIIRSSCCWSYIRPRNSHCFCVDCLFNEVLNPLTCTCEPRLLIPVYSPDGMVLGQMFADIEEEEWEENETLVLLPPPPAPPPPPLVIECKDGPVQRLLGGPNVFFSPPISYHSCDGLLCKDGPCIARVKEERERNVDVYLFKDGSWMLQGKGKVRYEEHLDCSCKTCEDIKEENECLRTSPCPNNDNLLSGCCWKHPPFIVGDPHCACVECEPPLLLDVVTCTCVCLPITLWSNGTCVGNCSAVPLESCPLIASSDNEHLNCQVNMGECTSPSCASADTEELCSMTKCVELDSEPLCIWDAMRNKCRCPQCANWF